MTEGARAHDGTDPSAGPVASTGMPAERWRALQRAVDGALDLPPSAREAYLVEACAGDPELHAEAVRLVTECELVDASGGVLDVPAAEFAAPLLAEARHLLTAEADERRKARASAVSAALRERYAIDRELGRGGMATVYLAHDLKHSRAVAIKVMEQHQMAGTSPGRFLREIRIAARLTHPHILGMHDSGEADGLLYYVMPYIEGETLRMRLAREGALPIPTAVRLFRELSRALACAHEHGVVHCDLKPENVLLSGGHAVIADFGIARAVGVATEASATLPADAGTTGGAIGTPAYMAPEQVLTGVVDHRTDLYALGLVAWEMLAGEHVFAARTSQELTSAHLGEAPSPLDARRPDAPEAVTAIIMQLLAKDPEARPRSASHVLHVLGEATAMDVEVPLPAESQRKRRVKPSRASATAVGLLLALAVGLGARAVWRGAAGAMEGAAADPGEAAPTLRTSVAVLPFQNTSGDPADDHFADGVTDELIGALGRIVSLHVTGRTSAFALKGRNQDLSAVAATLAVHAVVEGSVLRSGDRITIESRLVNAANGAVLWEQTYDRELADVFAVEDEIVGAVVGALQPGLGASGVAPRGIPRPSADLYAWELYLKGRHVFFARTDRNGLLQSIEYFEQAVARDSTFAGAYSGLADAYSRLAIFGYSAPRETFAKATVAARRALALDSTKAESHASLAQVRLVAEFDWAAAEGGLRRAIGLDPSYVFARGLLAVLLLDQGRSAEAISELEAARAIDPLSATVNILLGRALVSAGRPDDAIRTLQAELEFDPKLDLAYQQLGHAFLLKGQAPEAIAALRQAAAISGPRDSAQLAYGLAVTGQRAEAERILHELITASPLDGTLSYHIAMAYAGLGDADAAFRWLELGYRERASFMIGVKAEPGFRRLHADPRWRRLLLRMGLEP